MSMGLHKLNAPLAMRAVTKKSDRPTPNLYVFTTHGIPIPFWAIIIIISGTTARTGPWPPLTGFRDSLGMYDVRLSAPRSTWPGSSLSYTERKSGYICTPHY
jgi:hypothetical protein